MINKTKRLVISRAVKIARKEFFWGVTPTPGKHSSEKSVPLLTVLRDHLKLGDKEREITRLLNSGFVKIDGKVVKNRRTAVGFLDVLSIVPLGKHYRMVFDGRGRLVLREESEANSTLKPLKVLNKVTTKGGKNQLVFHDGQNTISDDESISAGDVVVVSVPDKAIKHVLKMQPGNRAFLTGGAHVGTVGTIKKVEVKKSSSANLIHFEEDFSTIADYAFVVGSPKFTFEVTGGAK